MAHRLSALLVVLVAGAARAAEPTPVTAAVDSAGVLDRPLVLPSFKVEGELSGGVSLRPAYLTTDTGLYSEASVQVGLPWQFQFGLFFREAVPQVSYESAQTSALMLNLQRGFGDRVAARVDFGLSGGRSGGQGPGPTLGLGVPFRYRFDDHFAFISGSTSGRAFGTSSVKGDTAGFTPSGDLLTVFNYQEYCVEAGTGPRRFQGAGIGPIHAPPFGGGGCGSNNAVALNLPLGMEFQPLPQLSFAVRTGFGVALGSDTPTTPTGVSSSPFYMPFSVDAVWTPSRHVDFGLTADSLSQPLALFSQGGVSIWSRVRL